VLKKQKQRRTMLGGSLVTAIGGAVWAIAAMLPLNVASNFGGFAGRTLGMKLVKDRSIARNLKIAFPQLTPIEVDRLTARIIDNIARVMAEMPHLGAFRRGEKGTRIEIEGLEHLPKGKPSVFVGGHHSNWEIGVVALCRHLGGLNTIYSPIGVPVIDRQLQAYRAETGAQYLPRNSSSLRTIFDDMEKGKSVAMLVDQRVATGPTVNFFGRPALASSLPARLAMRFNVPIIPVDGARITPSHFRVRLHQPIYPDDFPVESQAQAMSQAMMTAIEMFLRESPENWFCNKARWRETGAAAATAAENAEAVPDTLVVKEEF
jgi:KDO2-lipid IV(A) lauroyltransferase